MELREYQVKAVAEIRRAFAANPRVLLTMPTGAGKTVVFSYISAAAAKKGRVLILGHRIEIVEQISAALFNFGVPHGKIWPGMRQTYDHAQVGMVQTVARRIQRMHAPDFIIVDEAHHAVAGAWQKIIAAFPEAKVLGVTATPQRLDGQGLIKVFDSMVIGPTVKQLIELGFLSGFQYYAPPTMVDLSSVHTKMGDYDIKEIEELMDQSYVTGSAVKHYQQYLNGKPAIAFCTTLKHAGHVKEQFLANGWRADSIDGKMSSSERRSKVEALGKGQLNVLVSVDVVSEGFDLPIVSGAILLRPTKSLTLYLQQIGRALRPKPDGGDAVLLDHVGNCHRFGLPDEDRNWSLAGKLKGPSKGPSQCTRCYVVARARPSCDDAECPAKKSASEGREPPKEVDGELKAVQDPYAWAKGCNIALAQGEEFKALLRHAGKSMDRLRQIARIRGYDNRWCWHVLKGQWL